MKRKLAKVVLAMALALPTGVGISTLMPEVAEASQLCTYMGGGVYGCEAIQPDGSINYFLMNGPNLD